MLQSLALWWITTHLTWVMANPPRCRRSHVSDVFETSFKAVVTIGHGVGTLHHGLQVAALLALRTG